MANIKSQMKRIRTNERDRLRNQKIRSLMRGDIRKFEEAVANSDPKAAAEAHLAVVKSIDTAAQKGVIHKNKAANKKSQLAKSLVAVADAKPKKSTATKPAAKKTEAKAAPAKAKTKTATKKPAAKKTTVKAETKKTAAKKPAAKKPAAKKTSSKKADEES